jgi:hypothetical protein
LLSFARPSRASSGFFFPTVLARPDILSANRKHAANRSRVRNPTVRADL